eukprot:PhF_6_TR42919/c0_g1_i4/m.65064/K10396/KIF5; kinesin family member 5
MSTETNNVFTCIRIRPQVGKSTPDQLLPITVEDNNTTLRIAKEVTLMSSSTSTLSETKYSFDHVFEPSTQNKDVFDHTWPKISQTLLSGYNSNFCVYGQTGSGKTYTVDAYLQEIIPQLYAFMQEHTTSFAADVTYVQIYLDAVCDLLDGNKQVSSRGKPLDSPNLHSERADTPEAVRALLTKAQKYRKHAEHALNKRSSRAHTIFVLQLSFTRKSDNMSFCPKMYVVDLAGSERNSRTGATGVTFEESCAINKSLSCLAKCLEAMSQKASLIPFRESVLTMFLKEALSNTHFVLLCCVSP